MSYFRYFFLFFPKYTILWGCEIGRRHGHNLRVSKRSERNLCWLCDKSLPIRASSHSKHGRKSGVEKGEKRAERKKSECLIVALHWTRSIDVNKWPEGHCMASPWRGNKQTKQQQRRRQHQIGKSKLHVLHGRRWTRSSSRSGSGPVAFLVSRKFTAASHPFCLRSLCLASSALFVYFLCFLFSPFCCTGILFVSEFFTDLCAGSSWQGYVRVSGLAPGPGWPESVGTKFLTGKNQS